MTEAEQHAREIREAAERQLKLEALERGTPGLEAQHQQWYDDYAARLEDAERATDEKGEDE